MMKSARPRLLTAALAAFLCLPTLSAAGAAQPGQRDFLGELNRPILAISRDNQSYTIYYEALTHLDLTDPRLPAPDIHLAPGQAGYDDAIAFAADPGSQTAVEILLGRSSATGRNATEREVFGLPYGLEAVPEEMVIDDFCVYVEEGKLWRTEFAYLPYYRDLMTLLYAEANRRVEEGDTAGGVEAMIGMMRMARQLCDRNYAEEKREGLERLADAGLRLREFMWHHRDALTDTDYRTIAMDLDRFYVDRILLPNTPLLIGEQLIEEVFETDLTPTPDVFASSLARFESVRQPLKRFEAAAKWQTLVGRHASKAETVRELSNVVGDLESFWKLPIGSAIVAATTRKYDQMDKVRYALVDAAVRDLPDLWQYRSRAHLNVDGTATAAGIAGYMRKGGAVLEPGEVTRAAPQSYSQIQPTHVPSERQLTDPYNPNRNKFQYYVVTNRERLSQATTTFSVMTDSGPVTLWEGWPILYSVGPDNIDDQGVTHSNLGGQGTDYYLWPPLHLIGR